MSQQSPEGERDRVRDDQRKSIPGSRKSKCKGPEVGGAWHFQGVEKRSVWCGQNRVSEGTVGGSEVRGHQGQIMQGLCGHWQGFGLIL